MTWSEAKAYCEELGGHLAVINTKEELDTVAELLKEKEFKNTGFWIGAILNENGEYTWFNGEEFTFSNWRKGEPNNATGNENAAEMYPSDGTWNDIPESYRRGVVCEWDNAPLPEITTEQLDPNYLAGDSNCDGTVDLSDAVLIMQALANPDKYGVNGNDSMCITSQGIKNADVTGNDGMTTGDAATIQRYLLHLIPDLPEE